MMVKNFTVGKSNFLPFLTFFIIIIICLISFWQLQRIEKKRKMTFFADRVERAERAIKTRIADYNQILLGAKGFIEGSDTVTRKEWETYYEKINVEENYPGLQGLGYTLLILPENVDEHIQNIRNQGFPDYKIEPEGKRSLYSAIIYLEPFSGTNLRAFGYDMFSEPVRRRAMIKARDSGEPALSGKVTLVQEVGEDIQPGFLLYVPVYMTYSIPHNVVERRKLIKGYVYSPFRAHDLFNAILRYRFEALEIQIYDGDTISQDALLYEKPAINNEISDENARELNKVTQLNVSGHTWTIKYSFTGSPGFDADQYLSYIVLLGGIIFGGLIFFLMIFQGKTQAAERAAIESAEAKKFIIESMPEKVAVVDNDGNVTYVNQNWQDYTGMSLYQFKTSGWKEIVHAEDRELTEKVLKTSFASGKSFNIEHRLRRKDGIYKWHLSLGTAQKDDQGNVLTWVETHTDINEQKSQLEELRRINSDLDNFVYTASHDLKAPISNMEGLLLTIYDETKEHCSQEVTGLFDMINVSIQRLKTTISDLTEISRIQRGYDEQTEVIEISSILEEFKQDHNDLIKRNQAKINADLSVTVINFSRRNLRSIIYNLLSNAIKYRSPDRTPEVYIKTEQVEKCTLIMVADNGLGLNPDQKDRIFGMFKRMHSHVEGSGIGLYIVKRIVENAGGKIVVESEEGNGSVFKVYLPIKNGKAK